MAKYTVYITESKNYQTEVEAATQDAALAAALVVDTTTLTSTVYKSVSAQLA